MGATSRQDIITDDGLQAPLMLAHNIAIALGQNEKLLTSFQQLNKTLESATSAGKVKKQVDELTLAEKELVKVQNQIAVAQAKNTDEYRKEEAALVKLKKQIKEKTALGDREARSVNAQNASIKVLTAALNKNRDAYTSLATAEERASVEGQELLRIIQQQDKEVKELNKTIGKHQDEVGHYELALGKAGAAADALLPTWAGMARGIMSATKAAIAFVATPLGAVLALLALALAPIVAFLRDTGDGMDYVEEKTTGLKTGINVLKDEFHDLGQDILDGETSIGKFARTMLFSNPIVIAITTQIKLLREAFPGLAKRFDEAREAGEAYARMMDEVQTQQALFAVHAAEEENAIKRLILQSKNRTASEEERIALIDEALKREQELTAEKVQMATSAAAIEVEAARKRVGLQRQEQETMQEFGKRLAIELDKRDGEQRDRLLKSLTDLEQVRGESIAIEEKLQNQRDALAEKAEERDKKRAEARIAIAKRIADAIFAIQEIQAQRYIDTAKTIDDRVQAEIYLETLRRDHLLDNDKLLAEERAAIEAKYQATILSIRKKGAEDQIKQQEDQITKTIKARQDALDAEIAAIQEAAIKAGTKTADVDKQILEAKKRNAEETIRLMIEQTEQILAIEGLNKDERAKLEEELAKLKMNLTDVTYQHLTDTEKEALENTIKTLDKIKSIYQDFSSAISDLFGSITDSRLQELDEEQEALEEQYDKDIEAAGDNTKAKEAIEKEYQRKLDELDKKKVEAQRRQARFDKAVALVNVAINTAASIVKTSAQLGMPAAIPFIALAAALGAIQAAAIIAKPIPKYAHGVKNHPGGPAIVGDGGGAELIKTGGRTILSPASATIMDLPAGAEVIPHRETMRQLALSRIQPEVVGTREDAGIGVKLIKSVEKLGEDIRSSRVEINHIREGSVLYEARKKGEEFTRIVRAMSLGKYLEK